MFIPSQTNCTNSICYSQTLFNPLLIKSNRSRCTEIDCINTFLININQLDNLSNNNDVNKMMILVCSKLNIVNQIILSLNLNGEIFKNSLSFTFNLYECLDCDDYLIDKFDSWIENDNICSAFKIRINQPYSKSKEILYIHRVGYYLSVLTKTNKSDDIQHFAKSKSFIWPQTNLIKFNQECSLNNNDCLFFRGENVNENCLKQNDCTGRLMIHNSKELIELDLLNPLNKTDCYYLILYKFKKGK